LDPEKGYHAAFLAQGKKETEELVRVLDGFGIEPKISETREGTLVYLKESSRIEDLLSVMGAQKFSLDLMNKRIDKSIRGNINRRLNFDGANLKKTVNSSQNIISAIQYLSEKGILETLPEGLQNAAKLRLSYPEVSLSELLNYGEESLTKSGLNHRFQKICRLAEKLRSEEEYES
jgi:DNA-binding protein WhiA